MNLFAQITKIDAAKREVHGVMAEEAPDKAGEIFDYASSKPYVQEWSSDAAGKTLLAGQEISFGNVRSQHNAKIVAGKLVSIDFDDNAKKIPVIAKIVDDGEWAKVQEGVYTGFSMAGITSVGGPMAATFATPHDRKRSALWTTRAWTAPPSRW